MSGILPQVAPDPAPAGSGQGDLGALLRNYLGAAGDTLANFVQRWGQLGAMTNAGQVNTPLPTVVAQIPQDIGPGGAVSKILDVGGGLADYAGGAFELANNAARLGSSLATLPEAFDQGGPGGLPSLAGALAHVVGPDMTDPQRQAYLAAMAAGHPLQAHEIAAHGNEVKMGFLDAALNPLNYLTTGMGELAAAGEDGAPVFGRLAALARTQAPDALGRFIDAFTPLLPKGTETLAPAREVLGGTPDEVLGAQQEIPVVDRALRQAEVAPRSPQPAIPGLDVPSPQPPAGGLVPPAADAMDARLGIGRSTPTQLPLDLDPLESAIKDAVERVPSGAPSPLDVLPARYTPQQAALAPFYGPQHEPLVPYAPNLAAQLGGIGGQLGRNALQTADLLLNGPARAATTVAGKVAGPVAGALGDLAERAGIPQKIEEAVARFGSDVPVTVQAARDAMQRILGGENVTAPEAAASLIKAQVPDIAAEQPEPRDYLAYILARQQGARAGSETLLPGANQSLGALAAANAGGARGGAPYLGNLLEQVGLAGAKNDVAGALGSLTGDKGVAVREALTSYLMQRLIEQGGVARLADGEALGPLASPVLSDMVGGLGEGLDTAATLKRNLMGAVRDFIGGATQQAGEEVPQELTPGLYEDVRDWVNQTLGGRGETYLPGKSYIKKGFPGLEDWETKRVYQRLLSDPRVVGGFDSAGNALLASATPQAARGAFSGATPTPGDAMAYIKGLLSQNQGITPQTPEAWNTLTDLLSYANARGWERQRTLQAMNFKEGQGFGKGLAQSYLQQKQKPRSVVTDLMTDLLNAKALDNANPDELWRGIGDKLAAIKAVGPNTKYIQPLNDLLMDMGMPDAALSEGKTFADALGSLDDANSPVRSALNEALLTLMPGNWHTIPLGGPLLGALRGYYRPYQTGLYRALNDVIRGGTAETLMAREGRRGLQTAQAMFVRRLGEQGVDTAPLARALAAKGSWDVADLTRAYGNQQGRKLADVWSSMMVANKGLMEKRVGDVLGSFDRSSKVSIIGRAAFPFSGWVWRQLGLTRDMMLQHPQAALALLNLYHLGAERAFQQGLPGEDVGIPISDKTPVLGGLVKSELPGQHGTYYYDPLEGPLPLGGRTLDAREWQTKQGWEKGQYLLDALALQVNPAAQLALYAGGKMGDAAGLGVPSFDALGGMDQAMPGPLIPTATHFLDLLHQALGGEAMVTPEDRAMADVVMRQTGLPITSPRNAEAALEALTPGTVLWREAEAEARNGAANQAALNYVLPSYHNAISDQDQQLAYLRAHEQYQPWDIAAATRDNPALAAGMQRANSMMAYILPLLGVHAGIDQNALIQQALLGYRADNANAADVLGDAWAPYQAAEAQRLGMFAGGLLGGQPADPYANVVQAQTPALYDLLSRPVAGPGSPTLLDLLSR